MKQMTRATIKGFEIHGRATCKAAILVRMEMLDPWAAFCALIKPHYPKGGAPPPRTDHEILTRSEKYGTAEGNVSYCKL